jgi:hypothetical protein
MATYLVESYWPGVTESAFLERAEQADAAARELRATGRSVEFLGCLLVPGEEFAFWRFASESRAGVEEVSARARLPCDRVSESLEIAGERPGQPDQPPGDG